MNGTPFTRPPFTGPSFTGPLFTGRTGRLMALAILALLLLATWLTVAAPLLEWHTERATRLAQRELLAHRMAAVAASLATLQREATTGSALIGAAKPGPASTVLLEGATDAIAAAALQQRVQDLAATLGATTTSAETLPATPAGAYRQIGLHVTLRTPWPVLVTLLQRVEQASPRMLVDDLQVHSARLVGSPANQPLETAFTIFAFRATPTTTTPVR